MKKLAMLGIALLCVSICGPIKAQQDDPENEDSAVTPIVNDLATKAGALANQRQANRDAAKSGEISAMNAKNACRTGCNNNHNTCAQSAANARNQPGGIGAAMNACDAQNRACFGGC